MGGSEQIQVAGLDIAFERAGDGPPLLLLHGLMADSRLWRRQIDELADEFTVVAWDAPGCGASSDPPDSFRLPDYADCLAALADELDLERPHVLGLSFGSGVALELYRRHPELPRSLVLVAAYAGWAGSLPPDEVARRVDQGVQLADHPPREAARLFAPTLFSRQAPAVALDAAVEVMSDFRPAGVRAITHSMAEADLRDVLPRVSVPTLILYGDEDRRSPLALGEALHEGIPGSRLVVVPGAGHVVNLEAPERFEREVRRFLRGA